MTRNYDAIIIGGGPAGRQPAAARHWVVGEPEGVEAGGLGGQGQPGQSLPAYESRVMVAG